MPAGDDWGPFNIGHDLEWRFETVEIDVTSHNDTALQFTTSTGFRKVGKSVTYVRPPSVMPPPGQRGIKLRDDE